ncbi:Cof-type HAD-IIB family hydrolase [Halobacillus litoralis]|uniref:Cof-type HAD-IIB family hydrolase n=1 Tax=Halobacillus litoralis TaxID=45668 RepID=A0A845E639_9BACI|nr:Cof-type HAD-IIB family hydrolase [Halobacillus litoralis]MYL50730.1 Cof-type HAD-IIB family hydrolase [Halobacillus litoralis]
MDMIAIDLDGTLLNSANEISKNNIRAIQRAQSEGVEVIIATGRASFDVQNLFSNLELNTWVISANGATIHRPDGALFSSIPMGKEDVTEILGWFEKEGFYYEAIDDEAILTPQNGRELMNIELDRIRSANLKTDVTRLERAAEKQFSQTGFSHVDSYKEIVDRERNVYNILAFSFEEEKLQKGWERFKNHPDLTLVSSADHNFELEHRLASKGNAVMHLARQLNRSIERTAVIGDSLNDLSMMNVAGYSAAMGNGKAEVKEACHFLTKTNDEDGVAHAINHFLSL